MTPEQVRALKMIMDAIVESVAEAGAHGAPAGTLYGTLMSFGCSLDTFEQLMSALVGAGRLQKRGHLYFASVVPFCDCCERVVSAVVTDTLYQTAMCKDCLKDCNHELRECSFHARPV